MENRILIKHQSENITPVICSILNNLPQDCENVIEFEKGTYCILMTLTQQQKCFQKKLNQFILMRAEKKYL